MQKLISPKNLRNLIIALVVIGLLFLAVSGYLTPVFSLSFSPLIGTQSWLSRQYTAFRDYFTSPRDMAELRNRNAQLESELALLQSEIVALQEDLGSMRVLEALMGFEKEHPEYRYQAATVIGREISPFQQYIIIDKGSNTGIRHGMPVVTEKGLVGRIDAVIANASRIQLISDARSIVNVRMQTQKVEAQITGSLTGEITLSMVPQGADVDVGEVLLTSGLGGSYPPNIFVGQVLTMQSPHNTLFQTGSVQAMVDFNALSAVLVITDFTPVDITPLLP